MMMNFLSKELKHQKNRHNREQHIIDESFKILEEFKQDYNRLQPGQPSQANILQDFDFTDPVTPREEYQDYLSRAAKKRASRQSEKNKMPERQTNLR